MEKNLEGPSFSFIIDHIDDLYIETTYDLVITYVNNSVEKQLLLSSITEPIGTSFSSIFLFPDEWEEFLASIRMQKYQHNYQAFIKRNNGTFFIGLISYQQIFNKKKTDIHFEICIHDTTPTCINSILSGKTKIYTGLPLNINQGIWVYDRIHDHFYGSEQFYSIFGLIPGGKNLSLEDILSCIKPSDQPCINDALVRNCGKSTCICTCAFTTHKTESLRFFQMMGRIFTNDNQPTRILGIIQDITEYKQNEMFLLKSITEYEQKNIVLDELHSRLLDMNRDLELRIQSRTQQVEALLNQKDEFIIQIGHDLRTPLTPLVAILPLLRKRVNDPQCIKLLDIAITDVQSITNYISRIIALARKNPFYNLSDVTSIHVSESLDQIITNHSYLIYQKSLSIHNTVPSDITLEISPLHFEAIFNNIIGNAVKYSLISGNIEIIGKIQQENNIVEIIIRDDGIGIEKEDLPHIFEEFFKGDKSRHERDSYGLGLSIVKRIINMYNGTIEISSEGQGKGTTATVHLPLSMKQ